MSSSENDKYVDSILSLLTHQETLEGDRYLDQTAAPAIAFDGFEALDLSEPDKEWGVLAAKDPLDQPLWPLKCALAIKVTPESYLLDKKCDLPLNSWQFVALNEFKPQKWRGHIRVHLPKMAEFSISIVTPDGKKTSATTVLGLGKSAVINALGNSMDGTVEHLAVRIAGGLMLRRRYNWSVLLGEGLGARARFITDLTGAREAFRLRDIPPGKMRRAALRHWVKEHWRKKRSAGLDDRTFVEQHLRGAQKFTWNGLRCAIVPPEETKP